MTDDTLPAQFQALLAQVDRWETKFVQAADENGRGWFFGVGQGNLRALAIHHLN